MSHERLYLLESVGVVMEVKSNAQKQWKEIEKTGKNLKTLKRSQTQSSGLSPKYFQSTELPFLGVVFNGWKKEHTLETYRKKGPCDGILQLKPLMLSYTETNNKGVFQDTIIKGECALGAIAVILSSYLTSFNQRQSDLFKYF